MKIANRDARWYVQREHPFQGNNLFGEWFTTPDTNMLGYAVYSYGKHFPLFVALHGMWYENTDRHSVTTSKHRSQTHPHCDTIPLTTEQCQRLIRGGVSALTTDRLGVAA